MNIEEQQQLTEEIRNRKIIAIVRGVRPDLLMKTAEVFFEAGIRLMEIPYEQNEPENFECVCGPVREIRQWLPEMHVGAGTVMTVEQVDHLAEAGGEFAISADTNPEIIWRTKEKGMLSIPGAMTPSEIAEARRNGADFIKVFPAGVLGAGYIKALQGPMHHIPLMAVGGVNLDNLDEFWKAGCCGFGIGGNLANRELIEKGQFDEIRNLAEAYVSWGLSHKR